MVGRLTTKSQQSERPMTHTPLSSRKSRQDKSVATGRKNDVLMGDASLDYPFL
jgi:hypothetical protein